MLISLLGVWLFSRAGEAEAIRDAKDQTRIAAEGSVEPVLSDALLRGDPKAIAAVDRVIKERVLTDLTKNSDRAREDLEPLGRDRLLRRAAPDRRALHVAPR